MSKQGKLAITLGAKLLLEASAILILIGLVAVCSASAASFEQTGTFAGLVEGPKEPGVFPEEVQLGGVSGMAVNETGAGGAPAGTVYAATNPFPGNRVKVARYTPTGSGGLKFGMAWEITALGTPEPYERCGPEVESKPPCAPHPTELIGVVDVDVDQVTGNVYVLNAAITKLGSPLITEYSADGAKIIARFGQQAAGGKTIAETPELIHQPSGPGALAVNASGEVYLYDEDPTGRHRLMIFKPEKPGDFEHYVYGGELAGGNLGKSVLPERPVTDAAGRIYVTDETSILEYDPASPEKPICEFKSSKGGIIALTVNPDTGEPFFYSYKDKKLHRLNACVEGKFTQAQEFSRTIAAKRGDIYALAFDPKRQIGGRPPGVLYAGVPEPQGTEVENGAIGYIFAGAEENPPAIESQLAAKVSASTAELRALINPKGFDTAYIFEYLTEVAYQEAGESFGEAAQAPVGGAELGGGQSGIWSAVGLTGLAPSTAYRYRVVATSECAPSEPGKVCESDGAPKSFTTFAPGASALPDARAYELVSPAQKSGGQVLPEDPSISSCGAIECKPGVTMTHFPMQSAPEGNAVAYEGIPFGPGGAVLENEYLAKRGASGWENANLTPPTLLSAGAQGYKAFTPSLDEGILEQTDPAFSEEAPENYPDLYRQPSANPLTLAPLLTQAPPNRLPGGGTGRLKLIYAGASQDLSRVFFQANDELGGQGAGGAKEETNLYEWAGGELHLVSLGPGSEVIPGAVFGSGTLLKRGNPIIPIYVADHAISADGSRAFWSAPSGQLYVRIGGTETVEIPDHSGEFLDGAADGSRVLLSDGKLYGQLEAEPPLEVADLSQGKGGFEGIAGQSEDLSRIYFVDSAVLGGKEENSHGDKAQPGGMNLYLWEGGATSFIGTLLAADNVGSSNGEGDWSASAARRTAEASPDGGWLAFMSQAPLTGFDNTGPCKAISGTGKFAPGLCAEVFVFEAASGQLRCASCSPAGTEPLGQSFLRKNHGVVDSIAQPRYLTDSGRLFFDSRDSLVPGDSNGGAEDVYEFEPAGVGSCKGAGGCVSLISAGDDKEDSNFLAMDESGDNVFFTTPERLLAADSDKLIDLYDARVEGGFESEAQLPPSACSGEGCQPGTPPQPELPFASETAKDPGNVKPAPKHCRKGQVRRGNRCVKKAHRRRAKRTHRGGGAR